MDFMEVQCSPEPDAFNPCEDLMGNWGLRIPVWIIAHSAVIGNLFVLIVIGTSHFRLTVSKFLMCNLAVADLCIGVHLLLLAGIDAHSIGAYFNSAIDWQEGYGCNVAGFLTTFGNVLSVYTLAVITLERWCTITWAAHLNKRLKLRTTVKIMLGGWFSALFMAFLPLRGISSYSRTSICLPLEFKNNFDAIYLSTLLTINCSAFTVICVCYGSMYKTIRSGAKAGIANSVRNDQTVAKKMALLVFTDFACLSPIAFFGITALLGYPLITVTQTKILLVFIYPLNSCANPCLYAILTQQYRKDFFILMGRMGMCKEHAYSSRGAIRGKPLPYTAQFKRPHGVVRSISKSSNTRNSLITNVSNVNVEIPMTNSGRGHDETSTSDNPGIFRGLINFTAELDKTLAEHLRDSTVFKGISKEIQNDILDCMLEVCHETILEEIRKTSYNISIIADETTDVSAKSQMVVIFRYIQNGDPVERLWTYLEPSNLTAESLTADILSVLDPIFENSKEKLIAQSYDGAAVMSGRNTGVQAQVKEKYNFAHFVHCYAHQLNLIMSKAASESPQVRLFFWKSSRITFIF
ncbi:unnamed protein product [Ceutorhynchus assimilis]|uniref:DUF4371 domain-containing protein n=1 Tax=Ceutorhynchus assimilis TaxID=467358 RepID=A0A9N9QMW8_9CUCU|nr:unnamed protein product [Ceutorhynchus assimilis]